MVVKMAFVHSLSGVTLTSANNRQTESAMPTRLGEKRLDNEGGNPWEIPEWEFPTGATVRRQLEFLTRFAVLAPSGHNRQPWKFRIRRDQIDILADRSRSMPTADPRDRELIMSCGTALHHLRVAMMHYGITPVVRIFPNLHEQNLVASIGFGPAFEPTVEQHQLFMAIRHRRTHRAPFVDRDIDEVARERLRAAVESEDVAVSLIGDANLKERIARLVSEGELSLLADSDYVADLSRWIRIPFGRGIASGLSTWRQRRARRLSKLTTSAPLLVVLSTPTDTAPAWLAAGQAISHVLLKAREFGIFGSFVNQPVVAANLRPKIAELTGGPAYPQIILRMGYGHETEPTQRRVAPSVTVHESPETP